ncbi:hypothetical protein LR48_Vigan01g111500 [Vigna angularis]|uniref:Uncharacterized protein n=1 Tax=Phaseolus angularis TaxID=3914 RepID=A0A0L9TLX6_PHAAN|nr:hypothetical protein LR48_Vigan01g111500 [Vigna angularis]
MTNCAPFSLLGFYCLGGAIMLNLLLRMYLIHAVKGRLQTDWTTTVYDHMDKITKQNMASHPYVVFLIHAPLLSRPLSQPVYPPARGVSRQLNEGIWTNIVGFRPDGHSPTWECLMKSEIGWTFKDQLLPMEGEEVEPLNMDKSNASYAKLSFQPKTNFERFMVKQMKLQYARLDKVERSIVKIHRKLDDEFDNTKVFESDIEDEVDMENEGYINISY